MDLIHPASAREVAEALRSASNDGTRSLVVGGRTHIDKGDATEVDAELWTTQLNDVVAYDPEEMIAVVEAGMRLGELRRVLAEGGQEWPVDEPDDATVGGVIAAGVDPVRRLRVGTMRDSVVELRFVTGDGRRIRSGAPVVKNVSGFDVHRLLCGSLGTLGVITHAALKVRPLPKAVRTLVTMEGGVELGRRLLAAVPLPAAVLAESDRVIVRLEGWPDEVEAQAAAARGVVSCADLDAGFPPPLFPDAPSLVEASVVPSSLELLVDGRDRWRASVGAGTAWVACEDDDDLAKLRERVARLGGIAPVIRGPGGLGDGALPAPEVQRRIKDALDPAGILAPGRAWGL